MESIKINIDNFTNENEMIINADLKKLAEVRGFVQKCLQDSKISEEIIHDMQLVVTEGTINAIYHGSSLKSNNKITIKFAQYKNKIVFSIKDFGGKTFDPKFFEDIAMKRDWTIGGRGIYLINRLVDELFYINSKNKSTTLVVIKNI